MRLAGRRSRAAGRLVPRLRMVAAGTAIAGLVVADVATAQVGDLAVGAQVLVSLADRPVLVTAP